MEFFITSGCFDSFRKWMPVRDSGWDSIVYFENNLEHPMHHPKCPSGYHKCGKDKLNQKCIKKMPSLYDKNKRWNY